MAPVVRGRKGTHAKLLERAKRSGYVRVRIDGNLYELSEEITLDKNIKHNIEIIVDRLVVKSGIEKRLTDSVESVLSLAEGLLTVDIIGGEAMNFSQSFACPDCGISIEAVSYTHQMCIRDSRTSTRIFPSEGVYFTALLNILI